MQEPKTSTLLKKLTELLPVELQEKAIACSDMSVLQVLGDTNRQFRHLVVSVVKHHDPSDHVECSVSKSGFVPKFSRLSAGCTEGVARLPKHVTLNVDTSWIKGQAESYARGRVWNPPFRISDLGTAATPSSGPSRRHVFNSLMVRDEARECIGQGICTTRPPLQSSYLPAKWLLVDGKLRYNRDVLRCGQTYDSPYEAVVQISHPACGRTCDPQSLKYQVTQRGGWLFPRGGVPCLTYLLLSPHDDPDRLADNLANLLVDSAASLNKVVLALTIDPDSVSSEAGDPESETRTRYSADGIHSS